MSTLHVDIVGAGPPLVMLHGWAMHGGIFAPLVTALQQRHTLYVVDLPGHGHSRNSGVPLQLEACVQAVLAMVPEGAPWCGWSLGGLIALQAAATHPQQVPALVMLCATPRFVQADDWPHGMPLQVFDEFARGLAQDWQATVDRFLALEAFGSDHMREELQLLRHAVLARGAPDPRVLGEGLQLLETTDLRQVLPTLAVPSLWLAGRRDRLVNPAAVQTAANLTPCARALTLAHAGHAPFLTHADAVAQALQAFVAEAA